MLFRTLHRIVLVIIVSVAFFIEIMNAAFSQSQIEGERITKNLIAFGRAYGYIRYFYPSATNSSVNWNNFVIKGSHIVSKCNSDKDLVDSLQDLFRIFPDDIVIEYSKSNSTDKSWLTKSRNFDPCVHGLYWQHFGCGMHSTNTFYTSSLINSKQIYLNTNSLYCDLPDIKMPDSCIFRFSLNVVPTSNSKYPKMSVHLVNEIGTDVFFGDLKKSNANSFYVTKALNKRFASISINFDLTDVLSFDLSNAKLELFYDNKWVNFPISELSWNTILNGNWQYSNLGAFKIMQSENGVAVVNNDSISLDNMIFNERPSNNAVYVAKISDSVVLSFPLVKCKNVGQNDSMTTKLKVETTKYAKNDSYIAGVILFWNAIQHFYSNWNEMKKSIWDNTLGTALNEALKATNDEDQYFLLRKMVSNLNDGHGFVYHPLVGEYHGFPFKIDLIESKFIVVNTDSSIKDNLQLGDELISIDNLSIDTYLNKEKDLISGSEQWKSSQALDFFGYGKRFSKSTIEYVRNGKSYIESFTRDYKYFNRDNNPSFNEIKPGVFYINLSQISEVILEQKIPLLASAKGVIFDVRNRPRVSYSFITHLMNCPDSIDNWMQIPLTVYPDHIANSGYFKVGWKLKPQDPKINAKVVFLASSSSISYTESILSLVEFYKLGDIISESNTAGANGDICSINLPNNFVVYWSGMKVTKLDGSAFTNVGIHPTFTIKRSIVGIKEGKDELLIGALKKIDE